MLRSRPYYSADSLQVFAAAVLEAAEVNNTESRYALTQAFAAVPRSWFVESALASMALKDVALPIGFGQTISKPSTVAKMLSILAVQPREKVLEVGSGSGYVLALLSALGANVFGIERIGPLAQKTRRLLDKAALPQVILRCSDGKRGWPDMSPFSAVLVSTALQEVPRALLEQLEVGGRLLAPVLDPGSKEQRLELWTRGQDDVDGEPQFDTEDCGICLFVKAT